MLSNEDPTVRPPVRHYPTSSSDMRGQGAPAPAHGAQLSGSSFSARLPLNARKSVQTFYMQQRQGSNTSLDSASPFIDHRAQPRSIGVQGPSPLMARQVLGRPSKGIVDEIAVADEAMETNVSEHGFRRRAQSRSSGTIADGASPRDSHDGTVHTASRRSSALEQDVCFLFAAGSPPSQRQSHHQQQSETSQHHDSHDYVSMYPDDARDYGDAHHDHNHDDPEMHSNAPPGFPWSFDMQALEAYAEEERGRLSAAAHDSYITGDGAAGLRFRGAQSLGCNGTLKEPFATGATAAAPYGLSPTSDDATFWSRRPRRHQGRHNAAAALERTDTTREADESQRSQAGDNLPAQKQGRYQRKLALFESGGTAPPPQPDVFGSRQADAKTPLLFVADKKTASTSDALPQYNPSRSEGDKDDFGAKFKMNRSYSQPSNAFPGRRYRKPNGPTSGYSLGSTGIGAPSAADRPYRFTFYSNALPSTIHARYLAELPAKRQTFEELFLGLAPGALNGGAEERPTNGTEMDVQNSALEGAVKEKGPSPPADEVVKKPDSSQMSALTAQLTVRGANSVLGAGRKEGSTAPPSRAHTPVPTVTGGMRTSQPNLAVTRTTTIAPAGMAAATAAGRTVPGGGIRMDQDPEANTWWLDVLNPTDQEMKLMSRVFGIHPLTTEDILMEETREKIELFRNYYLVCFRSFDQDPYSPTYLEPLNMYIIVFREGTLSFHFRATPHPQNVRRRIKQLKDYINVTSDWISYALIDDITDAFGPLIQSIEYEVDSIDELVLILKDVEQSDMLRRIGACRKKVMGLLRLMGNKADVVKGLAKRCNENWSVAPKSDIGLYLSDIQDHLITMTQNLSHFEKILSRSHSNYLAQISIEMTEANNRANDVLSKLTALGTVIVPLNVITGLWGMNVHVPGQDVPNLHWFGGLVAFMIMIAVSGYWVAIRYLRAD